MGPAGPTHAGDARIKREVMVDAGDDERLAVSIVMVGRNEERYVGRSLTGVFTQDYGGRCEVIFIDSGSTDRTVEIASSYSLRMVKIAPEAFHHGRTRNLGVRLSRGEIIVFLNADAVPLDARWLSELVRAFEDERVQAAHSRLVARTDAGPAVRAANAWNYGPTSEIRDAKAYERMGMKIFFFTTVSGAVRKAFLERFPFPEDLEAFEDRYLALRIMREGYATAYVSESIAEHSHNYPARRVFQRYFDLGMIDERIGIHDFGNGRSRLVTQGAVHVAAAIRGVGRSRGTAVPGMVLYDGCKFLGYMLGKRHRLLPAGLVRRIRFFR